VLPLPVNISFLSFGPQSVSSSLPQFPTPHSCRLPQFFQQKLPLLDSPFSIAIKLHTSSFFVASSPQRIEKQFATVSVDAELVMYSPFPVVDDLTKCWPLFR
jgi:hypothetical protein